MRIVSRWRDSSVSHPPPAHLVESQLNKILASPAFGNSERNRRLFRHLVSMTLAGRSDELKERLLAAEVFGRGNSFDPRTDGIVRVGVWQLRTHLAAYYSGDGRDDSLVIDLPNRCYVPVFKRRENAVRRATNPRATRHRMLWISAVLLIIGAAVFNESFWLFRARALGAQGTATGKLVSVAVLPFVNSDGDALMEQFAAGLTEEIIQTGAKINGLHVLSGISAKGNQEDVRAIGVQFNVEAVLEVAIHRAGEQLHIAVRLINVRDGYQYYSNVYERELKDAVSVQKEIAMHVAHVVRVHQKVEETSKLTKSAEARRLYLQGTYHASRMRESELRRAIHCFQKSIEYDANYFPAYTGLSNAYILLALLNEAPPQIAMRRAAEAARSAVRTGDTFGPAHAVLGSVLGLYEWDWSEAEKEFRKATEWAPNDPQILQQYSMRYLVPQGKLDSARLEVQWAQEVDTFSAEVMFNRGRLDYFKGDFPRALRAFRLALDLDPQLEVAPLALAEAYLQSSSFNEALKILQQSSAPTEDEARLAILGSVYGLSRDPERARQILQRLEAVARDQYVSGYYFSQIHLALGETDRAIAWLEKAAHERSPLIAYIKVAPQFAPLLREARFQSLLKRIGLER